MALSIITSNEGTSTDGANFDITTGASDGDLVIIGTSCFGRAGNEGRIGNALSYNEVVDVTNTQRLRVAWKTFVSGEDTVTIEGSGNASDAMTASLIVLRGHDTSAPMDATPTTANATSTNPDPAAIVPASDDCAIVTFTATRASDASPGTMTNYTTPAVGIIVANDTNNASGYMSYRLLTGGAGVSEDPPAWSTVTVGAWVTATLAIKPSGVAAGQPAGKRMGGVPFANYRSPFSMWRSSLLLPRRPSLIRI